MLYYWFKCSHVGNMQAEHLFFTCTSLRSLIDTSSQSTIKPHHDRNMRHVYARVSVSQCHNEKCFLIGRYYAPISKHHFSKCDNQKCLNFQAHQFSVSVSISVLNGIFFLTLSDVSMQSTDRLCSLSTVPVAKKCFCFCFLTTVKSNVWVLYIFVPHNVSSSWFLMIQHKSKSLS